MDPVILTPRLKLTLLTTAERGSPELEWVHKLCCDEKAMFWSISGQAKTLEDTEKILQNILPANDGDEKRFRVGYAVHRIEEAPNDPVAAGAVKEGQASEFIGLVTLKALGAGSLALPEHLTLPATAEATTLTLELGYFFLPGGWGKGFATEAVRAAFEACRRMRSFWTPFSKVYVRALVNASNLASQRVGHKVGMIDRGVYEWTGKAVFIAGEWRERDSLHIFGIHLLE